MDLVRKSLSASLVTAGMALSLGGGAALAQSSMPLHQGSITLEHCLQMTLRTIKGTPLIVEYKTEDGTPQYEFEVRDAKGGIWNVECDATTGHIIEIEQHVSIDHPLFAKSAKLSLEEAQAIALAHMPGIVERYEILLDQDGPAYEFDIQSDVGREFKVEIDAASGAVTSISPEYWEIGEGD